MTNILNQVNAGTILCEAKGENPRDIKSTDFAVELAFFLLAPFASQRLTVRGLQNETKLLIKLLLESKHGQSACQKLGLQAGALPVAGAGALAGQGGGGGGGGQGAGGAGGFAMANSILDNRQGRCERCLDGVRGQPNYEVSISVIIAF